MERAARALLAVSLISAAGLPRSATAQDAGASPALSPGAAASSEPVGVPAAAPATPEAATQPELPVKDEPAKPEGQPVPAPPPAGQPAAVQPAPAQSSPTARPSPETARIQFNFKDAPYDQVIDFFSRESGLPVIFETPAPQGEITFISGADYSFDEALSILNLNMARAGVNLRRQGTFLYLASIQDAARKASRVEGAEIDPAIKDDQIITVTLPLNNARAETVADQIKPLVGQFGSVTAVPQQNMVIVVETAAQCRRIRDIVGAIDAVRPVDSAFRLFPLKHAQHDAVLTAMKGLMGERQRTVVIDKDGQQRVVQDQNLAGLNLASDPRTNSIIAVGPAARIRTVEEVINLLDVPEGAGEQSRLTTISLGSISADEAAAKVGLLFEKLPPKSRPNVIPLPGAGKIALVGDAAQAAQAAALLAEIDPVGAGQPERTIETRAAIVRLKHLGAASVESVAERILTPAQRARLKFTPTGDGRGFIVAGLDADVAAFEKLVSVIDSPEQTTREVRVVRINAPVADPAALVRRVRELDQATGKASDDPVDATLDEDARTLTLIGSAEGIARFESLLSQAQATHTEVEARLFAVNSVKPSELAAQLSGLMGSMLEPGAPRALIEPIDDIKKLAVRAEPSQFALIEQLIRNLDTLRPAERPPLRIIQLRQTDAANLAQVLQTSFDQRTPAERTARPVSIQADAATNTLIVSAHEATWPEIESIVSKLNETQQVSATDREVRVFPLKVARAEELAQTLDQMYPEPPAPLDPRTRQPRPDLRPPREVVVRADRGTNSIIVDAPSKRLAGFEQLVRSLDQQRLGEAVDVRTYALKSADPNGVAAALRDLSGRGALRGAGDSSAATTPVSVSVEPTTRSLIVSGPKDAFERVEALIRDLDQRSVLPSTDVKLFPLQHARSERLAPVLQRILSSRLRETLLAAGKPENTALLEVASDAPSNTLIVSAPSEVIGLAEGIVRTLDQQSVAGAVEVRVFRLSQGQAATAAPALQQSINAQNTPGEPPASITAEASSNCIVAVGTSSQLDRAAKLVKELDATVDPEGLGVRSIPLKTARAEVLAPVVQSLLTRESPLDKLPDWMRAQAIARGGVVEPASVRVVADARSNAVVVSGPQAALELAEKVVASLDVEAGMDAGRAVRVLTLKNADASEMASNLEAVLKDDTAGGVPATIRVDRSSNSLIVRGSDAQLAQLDALAQKLDQAAVNSGRQLRMVPLDRTKADAEMMARTLRRLLEQQGGVKVEVIPASKLLEPTGAGEADQEPKKTGLWHGVPSRWAPQWAAITSAMAMAAQEEQPSEDADLTIGVDPETNALILLGSPRVTDRVQALAMQLQSQLPAEPTSVKIITLPPGVDAQSVVGLVNQTIGQVGRSTAQNPGGLTGPVSLLADPSGSAVIALSNQTDFEFVSQLVASVLEVGARAPLTIKVYPLANTTAARARQAMLDFVSAQPQGFQSRRIRGLELTLDDGSGNPVKAAIDPASVRVSADPTGTSLIVAAPAESMALIDRFVGLIDQSPTEKRLAIRRYELKNARAAELTGTLQQLFDAQRQGPGAAEAPQARFVADQRGNAILVTASDAQHTEVGRLLETADATLDDKDLELALIPIRQSTVSSVRRIIEDVILGRDPGRRERLRLGGDDASNVLIVRAAKEDLEQVRAIVAQVDSSEAAGLPVRSLKLDRADASAVASALQRFFADRAGASSGPGRRVQSRIAVFGDKRSGTLVVAAADDDFEQVKSLASALDTPSDAQAMTFKLIPLKNARVTDIEPTIRNIADQLTWERMNAGGAADRPDSERLILEPNSRTNSIVLMGTADAIASAERIIAALDQDVAGGPGAISVKSVAVGNADLTALKSVIERALATPGWRSWRGPDPDAVTVEVDKVRRALVLVGKSERVEQASKIVAELDAGSINGKQTIESITLEHARAERAAQTLRQFFAQRAEAQGLPPSSVSIIGSPDGNVLILAADEASMKSLRDLVAQIDQPQEGADRRIEVYVLQNVGVQEAAGTLRAMFPPTSKANERIVVTPQPSTGSLIVSAPGEQFEQLAAVIKLLDAPPTDGAANIATVALGSARAAEVAQALRQALPTSIKITITPVARSNSILLTGSNEAIALVTEQIRKIDSEPVKSTQVFRRITLEHAAAEDVYYTLRQMVRARPGTAGDSPPGIDYTPQDNALLISATAEQMEEILRIVQQVDVATATTRKTEFVKLQFADAAQTARALEVFYGRFAPEAATVAARAVTILPDNASNSLVISADEKEWEGLRALLSRLDTKEYDTSRQLSVIPLRNADAVSVARALSEGFRQPLEDQIRRDQARRNQQPRQDNGRDVTPTIVLGAEGTPTVSAEAQTNSLIVFAAQRDQQRIEAIVTQLDVPGFANLPTPSIIALKSGKPTQIAATLREMFIGRATQGAQSGPRAVAIVGDDAAGALIVRADESQLAQIRALAESLTQSGENAKLMPQVVRLNNVPAARLRTTLLATFAPVAQQLGETLAIEVDRGSNALVVAASPRLFEQVKKVIEELDTRGVGGDAPEAGASQIGQSVTVVDVVNNAPDRIKELLDEMGVSRPQAADRPGIVSEPVTVVTLASRQAIAVVGSPADGAAIAEVVRAIDAAPVDAEQKTAVVPLKLASAPTLVQTLQQLISPLAGLSNPQQASGPARALAEQVRRLSVVRSGIDQSKLEIDLSRPIRLIADVEANAVVVSSTPGNVIAMLDVITTLDTLPIGESVVVRIFPLENASATRVKNLVDTLFTQGEQLRRIPGTRRQGLPSTATGKALAGEIAAAVDERTNALIVAGREEALALVEVLIKDLDSDRNASWVEPSVIQLKYADAVALADKLREVLVRGLTTSPEAAGLQRQFARLRMVAGGASFAPTTPSGAATQPEPEGSQAPSKPGDVIQADLFAPVTGLVVSADETINALIVVATPANLAVVRELVSMLDVEAAAAGNTVRVFPLQYAASERIASIVSDIFRQRERNGALRPEDRLVISADTRTNSILASTSVRSFAILEGLLKTLDGAQANYSVGLHILPVEGAPAVEIAPKIERLMNERLQAAARQGAARNPLDAFSIEAEPNSNLLIVAASDENLQVVKELLVALTGDSTRLASAGRTELIPVTAGSPADLVASLRQLYVDKENARRGPNSVTVVANDRLNALLVGGTQADIEAIRGLIDRLQSAAVTAVRDVRRIELKSANALEVVNLLENVLAGRPLGGRGVGQRQVTKVRFLRDQVAGAITGQTHAPATEADIDGAIREQITLTPDIRTNSVVVNAPPEMLKLIEELVRDVDQSAAGLRRIETYQLRNADARSMAELLRDTFNLRQQGNSYVLVPARGVDDSATPGEGAVDNSIVAGTNVTAVPDQRQQLSIAIDSRTNTIIVSGTDEYLELVGKVITQLDSIEAQERDRVVYHLRNSKAKEIEVTLQNYFRGESSVERQTLGPELTGSLARVLEREVTVVGDEKSNMLVISTSPRYMDMVLKIIEELDSAPPQVMIEVLLAEVTVDSSDQWGMDIRVGPFGGDNYTASSSASSTGVLSTGLGVPNLSVSSADFGLLIRALQAQGKLEILSNPQVMVNNNQRAEIQVGDNIAIVTGVERLPQGNIRSDVERQNVGVILNVTPAISNDGFVRMDINPEISQLSARTTQISEDFQAPVINQRTVQTTVTVKDGQSVVIGGLIQSTTEDRKSKVPIIGDIPILGLPFQTTSKEARKTELLIILTPRVIPGSSGGGFAEAADQLSRQSIERMKNLGSARDHYEMQRMMSGEEIAPAMDPSLDSPSSEAEIAEPRMSPSAGDPVTEPVGPIHRVPPRPREEDVAVPGRPTPYREVTPGELK